MPAARLLTKAPKAALLECARDMVALGTCYWRKVVFSDENRFTLDGPDGLSAHWSDTSPPCRYHHTH